MDVASMNNQLLIHAKILTLEVKGTTSALKKGRYTHFALIENGGDKLIEKGHTSTTREGNEVKVKWDLNQDMLFALSSKIRVVIYSKGNLFKHKVGQYDGYFMDLVGKDDPLPLKTEDNEKIKSRIGIKAVLATDSDSVGNVAQVIAAVDEDLSVMKSQDLDTPAVATLKSSVGGILKLTKIIMDQVADVHPIAKLSWAAFALLYKAVKRTGNTDEAVEDLAENLCEMLGVASASPELLVIKGTTDVISDISLLSLRIASVIHEYTGHNFTERLTLLSISESFQSRISKYNAECKRLMEKFDRRIIMGTQQGIGKLMEILTLSGGQTEPPAELFRPVSTTRFVGRDIELNKLKESFQNKAHGSRCSFLLHGMGGIGKTQLCLQFVEQAQKANLFSQVFFVDAATEQSLLSSFKGLFQNLPALKFSGRTFSPKTVLDWISKLDEEWLIVYDNAEDFVSEYLPSGNKGNVLMTSQNPGLARHTSGLQIALDQMTKEDALSLFKSSGCHSHLSAEDEAICKEIVDTLEFFPLAIDLAGAYTAVDTGFCDLNEYMDLFSKGKADMLNVPDIVHATPYHNTVYGAWELSIKTIEAKAASSDKDKEASKAAITLIHLFAFFHHSNIDEEIFKRAATGYNASNELDDFLKPPSLSIDIENLLKLNQDGTWNMTLFRKGIQILCSASLLKKNKDKRIYSIHPLIHQWSKDSMSSSVQAFTCYEAYKVLLFSIPSSNADYVTIQPLIPHIKVNQNLQTTTISKEIVYNDYLSEKLQFMYQTTSDPKEKGVLLKMIEFKEINLSAMHPKTLESKVKLGIFYYGQEKITKAENILLPAINAMKEVIGEDNPLTLRSMKALADVYTSQNKFEKAETLLTTVLQSQRTILGHNDPDTLSTLNCLPSLYRKQGQFKKAEEMFKELLLLNKEALGDGHIETLNNMVNLALNYMSQEQYKEAEILLLEAINKQKSIRGNDHQNTFEYKAALGYFYLVQNNLAEAETIFANLTSEVSKILEEDHELVLFCKAFLASIYLMQDRLEKAENSIVPLLDIAKSKYGNENSVTLFLMQQLIAVYCLQEKLAQAEAMCLELISIYQEFLEDNDEQTLSIKKFLLQIYIDQEKWKEAQNICLSMIKAKEKTSGKEHPDTLFLMHELAHVYDSQENYVQAEEMYSKVILRREKVLGREHEDTLLSKSNLAAVYNKQKNWQKAQGILLSIIETRKKILGKEHPDTLNSMHSLAFAYHNQGNYTQAEEVYSKVISQKEKVLGNEHELTLLSKHNLAITYHQQKEWQKEQDILLVVIKARIKILGEEHPDTLSSMYNLAYAYDSQGNYAQAEKMYSKVTSIREKVLGKDHISTLLSKNNLAITYKMQEKWPEAQETFLSVIEVRTKLLGREHSDTISSMHHLAFVYNSQGNYTQGETVYFEVISAREKTLGKEHVLTLFAKANLGAAYIKQGRMKEAEEILTNVWEVRKRVLGEEHKDTLYTKTKLDEAQKALYNTKE